MLHKLGKSNSLSLAQNYLILSMSLGRSFVFRSFLQHVGLFRVYFCCSGLVLDSHHVHSHCSGPTLKHSHHTLPRYSVPVRMPSCYPVPVRMPPAVYRDHHHPTVVGMANERHQQGNHDYLIELSSNESEESDNDVQVIEHIEPDPKPISELWLNTDPDNSSTLHSENNPDDEAMSTDNDFIGNLDPLMNKYLERSVM